LRKVLQEDAGMGREEGGGRRWDVDCGVKGDEVEGVESALSEVEIVSSMRLRDVRRNVRSVECEKQKVGVRWGCGGGEDIMRCVLGGGGVVRVLC
jgi:hypothetical protein